MFELYPISFNSNKEHSNKNKQITYICLSIVFIFFIIVVAAAEAVVGLAIILSIYRTRNSLDIEEFNLLKW